MQIDAVFVPHITDFWAPASVDGVLKPNVPFTCTLLDPCDEETIQTSTKVYYDKVAWDKLRRLPGHEGLPAFKDVATSLIPATNFTHDENNIADLESISEGHILHTIRSRYKKKSIYTNVGRVVVAMNPFQNMPNLINLQMIKTYSAAEEPYMLAPHIYQISAASFQGVSKHHKDQSILITGESGAGKTESTKIIIHYFASSSLTMASNNLQSSSNTSISDMIINASPIMEAFGNASTCRNANSSRFGKWISLQLDDSYRVRGAFIQAFMLELPRVIQHLEGDRSYHIFYHVLQNILNEKEDAVNNYNFLKHVCGDTNRNTAPPIHQKINDKEMYDALISSLTKFNMTKAQTTNLFNVVSGILYLGNITFQDIMLNGGEGSEINTQTMSYFQKVVELLGVDSTTLRNALLYKKIFSGHETITVPLKQEQASRARDGLATLLYGNIFQFVIRVINDVLKSQIESTRHISILDIAGFENFQINSLEQLLINISNENLQNIFNEDILANELEDYKKEGLSNLDMKYESNSSILKLLEGNGGIISLLDEELLLPRGSEEAFLTKINKKFTSDEHFVPAKFAGSLNFTIRHFAGTVEYTCTQWLEKNRFNPPKEAVDVLTAANNFIVKDMGKYLISEEKNMTVAKKFKDQLTGLMTIIRKTDCHYVRCIKPNPMHDSWRTNSREIIRQLRCSGVIDVVRMRKFGFSLRLTYDKFVERYGILVKTKKPDHLACCKEIMASFEKSETILPTDIFYGKNKFMAKENVRQLLERRIKQTVESLKTPIEPFIHAYEQALDKQKGMFLFPTPLLGPTIVSYEDLNKECKKLDECLQNLEKHVGSLENGPPWFVKAINARDAMKKEILVGQVLKKALDKASPLSCTPSVVAELQDARNLAEKKEISSHDVDKICILLNFISEEKDWELQLNQKETDLKSLLYAIEQCNREFFTPSCHEAFMSAKKKIEKETSVLEEKKSASNSKHLKSASSVPSTKEVQFSPDIEISKPCIVSNPETSKFETDTVPPVINNFSRKAMLARAIAKKKPTTKIDPLKLVPRPKASMK